MPTIPPAAQALHERFQSAPSGGDQGGGAAQPTSGRGRTRGTGLLYQTTRSLPEQGLHFHPSEGK